MSKKTTNKITPSCSYCQYSQSFPPSDEILCNKKGIVEPNSSCKKFLYDPLKRQPRKPLLLPDFGFEESDFSLDIEPSAPTQEPKEPPAVETLSNTQTQADTVDDAKTQEYIDENTGTEQLEKAEASGTPLTIAQINEINRIFATSDDA